MENTEPRKLNMEEKRKLERLLLSDIDAAEKAFVSVLNGQRNDLVERLTQNPAADVRAAHDKYKLTYDQHKAAERALYALGYRVDYSDRLAASSSGTLAKPLVDFDEKISATRQSLTALKRRYIMRLFADNADTQSLFDSLARDLKESLGV
jgi:hypothetical protein